MAEMAAGVSGASAAAPAAAATGAAGAAGAVAPAATQSVGGGIIGAIKANPQLAMMAGNTIVGAGQAAMQARAQEQARADAEQARSEEEARRIRQGQVPDNSAAFAPNPNFVVPNAYRTPSIVAAARRIPSGG